MRSLKVIAIKQQILSVDVQGCTSKVEVMNTELGSWEWMERPSQRGSFLIFVNTFLNRSIKVVLKIKPVFLLPATSPLLLLITSLAMTRDCVCVWKRMLRAACVIFPRLQGISYCTGIRHHGSSLKSLRQSLTFSVCNYSQDFHNKNAGTV